VTKELRRRQSRLLDLLQPLPRGMRVGGERHGDQDDRNHKNQNDGQNKQARQKFPLVAGPAGRHPLK
jgi:hypothetical protein